MQATTRARIAAAAPAAQRRALWLLFWTGIGLFVSLQRYVSGLRFSTRPETWWQSVRGELPDWYVWGLAALLFAALARRFPITRANWPRAVPAWMSVALPASFAFLCLAVTLQAALHLAAGDAYPLGRKLIDNFTIYYVWNVLTCVAILAVVHARVVLLERDGGAPPAPSERFLVRQDGRSHVVRVDDVRWIQAAGNYVRLHTPTGVRRLRATLADLEARLDGARFCRISRSTIVNVDCVQYLEPWFHGDAIVVMDGGARLRLSRTYRAAFTSAFG